MNKLNRFFLPTLLGAAGLTLAVPASASKLDHKVDGSPITLSGEVVDSGPNHFTLDYGHDVILVEMDDWSPDADAWAIDTGQTVKVTGRVDHDFYETRKVEAGSVYVYDLNTLYTASSADEETPVTVSYVTMTPPEGAWADLRGTVEAVNGREFTLDTGVGEITVDTVTMSYNPLDNIGYQRIEPGQEVSVWGKIDEDFFGDLELNARTIVTYERS